jgi:hypothetical protein
MSWLGIGLVSENRTRRSGALGPVGSPPVLTPGAAWTGELGSGFSTVPVDPVRVTAKPALRLLTPANQHFSQTLDVGVIAMANDRGTLVNNFGIEQITFHYEGRAVSVAAPSWNTVPTERGARTYFGWWVRLHKPVGQTGKAQLYVEAQARDPALQRRVIGPFNFSPTATEYDLELEINPDLPVITGQRYQSFWPAISYARAQAPHNPRFLITKPGKYEIERSPTNSEAPTDQYAITGRYTVEATVPGVSIGKLAYVNDTLASIPGHRTYWRLRGSNITLDTRYMSNWTARATNTFPNDIQHWMDGITVTTTDPTGKDELFRGGTTPRSSQVVFGFPHYTECHFIKQNTPCNAANLVRGCLVEDSSQDIVSNARCVVHSTFEHSDQDFWNSDTPAITVTIPTGDTLSRAGGNYSSGTGGGIWTAIVSGVTYTYDVGNGSELYYLRTPTGGYKGASGIGGYWVSDVVAWLGALPGWSATITPDFAARDRVASALSRPGLVGQGFDVARGTQIVGNGTAQTIVWNVNTHGDWHQHSSGVAENRIIAFNRGWDLEVQLVFLAPILANGIAGSHDYFIVGNLLAVKPDPVPGGWNPDSGASQLSRPQDMSHCVIAHNTFANQRFQPNFTTGNVRDGGYNLVKNNAFRAFTWLGGVVARGVTVDGVLIHEGQAVPDGVTNYIVTGNSSTLFADFDAGDFTPTALMRQVGLQAAIPVDLNQTPLVSPTAPGGVAAVANSLLVPPVVPEPTDILGPAGLALASAIGSLTHGGMWLFAEATNPGLWRAMNLAGDASDFTQGTAASQPAIGPTGAVFGSDDQINATLFAGPHDIYVLLRKNAPSTVGQIIRNQVILSDGSITPAVATAGASVWVNGLPVSTRAALFTALDAETAGNTRWAEVRVDNIQLAAIEIGRSPADAFAGDILAVVALPRFAVEASEELAALRALARAWMEELQPALPAYPAVPPDITALSISGTAQNGQVLTAVASVTGAPPIGTTFQWEFNGIDIAGQTASTITLNEAGMGLFNNGEIAVRCTATNAGGSDTARATITFVSALPPPINGWVANSSNSASSGTGLVLTVPAGAAAGDLLVVHSLSSLSNPHSAPAGWTAGPTSSGHSLFYRTWDGVTPSFTFTTPASVAQSALMQVWRGYAFGVSSTFSIGTTNQTPQTITVPANSSISVQVVSSNAVANSYSMPAGWTARGAVTSNRLLMAFQRDAKVAAGALPGVTMTRTTGTSNGAGLQYALSPI